MMLPPRRSVTRIAAAVGLAGLAIGGAIVVGRSFLAGSPAAALGPPRFVEEAATAGIGHVYDGDFTYFVGGGVAAFDCDDDGRPELFVAGGTNRAALYHNDSPVGGALRFGALVSPATDLESVVGAYPLDIDGDAITDLAVLRLGENVLLRGLGDCRFERANERWGIPGGQDWTAAFSARWESDSPLPTLAFGTYLGLEPDGSAADTCGTSRLIRPAATGAGYGTPIDLEPGYCTLSMLFSDWDRSGRGDLRLSNDRHYARDAREQLWRIAPGEPPRPYTDADGWQTVRIWGMGIASQDLTGDGLPEVFLTSQGDNKLQTLAGEPGHPTYTDIALRSGATVHRPFSGDTTLPSTAWHAEFQDVNNDAFMDLFVAKGNVEAMPDYAARDPSNLLLGQPDGTFREAADQAGIVSFARARGASVVDLNLDGLLDIVAVNRREPLKAWRNVGSGTAEAPAPMGRWLAVRLAQPGGNRDAIGAWLEVRIGDRVVTREVTVGGGHAGGQLGWIQIGLGSTGTADVRVQWPGGEWGPWQRLEADGHWIIERAAPGPRRWTPPG